MLNILPKEYKTTLHQSLLYHRVRRFSSFVLSMSIVLGALMLSTEWLLQRWYATLPMNNTIAQITPEERAQLEILITDLQRTSLAVQTTAQQFHNPLNDVTAILTDTPASIELHELSIDYTTTEMHLTGTAADRENLFTYQQTLSQTPFLDNVTFPLNNLDMKEQIPFSVSAKIRYDEISQAI